METSLNQHASHEEGAESPAEIKELRAQIALGLTELERGEGAAWDIDDVRAEGRRMLNAGKEQAS